MLALQLYPPAKCPWAAANGAITAYASENECCKAISCAIYPFPCWVTGSRPGTCVIEDVMVDKWVYKCKSLFVCTEIHLHSAFMHTYHGMCQAAHLITAIITPVMSIFCRMIPLLVSISYRADYLQDWLKNMPLLVSMCLMY